MTTSLEIENLGKQFSALPDQWLFRDFTTSITEPDIIGILGKPGQGKSTLLRILGRLAKADQGTIRLDGKEWRHWEPEARRMTMSDVAQQPVMLPGTVEDNLRITSVLHQRPFDEKLARACLEQLAMDHLEWGKPAHQLSDGEKQRLAISKQTAGRLLFNLHMQTGTTLLWITHDLEEDQSVCKRIWFIAKRSRTS